MSGIPDRIVLGRHRELEGRSFNRPLRYVLLALIAAVPVLGLANLFGQRPETITAHSTQADLELLAPAHLRGGLLYEARFTVLAHEKLTHAALMLSPGWAESMTINTIEPSPIAETSRDGNLLLTLGTVPKGQRYTLYLEFQVNPTNVGRRHADVVLYDGDERLLSIDRAVTVFP
jgi:hypothetical protein